jgi:hypothetical protein
MRGRNHFAAVFTSHLLTAAHTFGGSKQHSAMPEAQGWNLPFACPSAQCSLGDTELGRHENPVDGVISEAEAGQAFAIRGNFAVRSRFRFSGLFTLP